MKNKLVLLLIAAMLMLCLVACGNDTAATTEADPQTAEEPAVVTETAEDAETIEVDETLFNVELTIPAAYLGDDVTQESLDAIVAEEGYMSATLNEDGTVTYVMTKGQHDAMLEEMAATIDTSLAEMIGAAEYPAIVAIESNDDYTSFDVTISTETVGAEESMSVLAFYLYGGMYQIFCGNEVDDIAVNFINQTSGEVIETAHYSDMQ